MKFRDLCASWRAQAVLAGMRDLRTADSRMRLLIDEFGDRGADEITAQMVAAAVRQKSPATANRYAALASSILRHGFEHGDIPAPVSVKIRKEPKRAAGFLSRDEVTRLIDELRQPMADMARLAVATGLRQSNVTGLRWKSVDLGARLAWIEAEDAKGGRTIPVPLSDDAVAVLSGRAGLDPVFVFGPGARVDHTAFKRALYRARLPVSIRWHDLRHTWASWHAQAGTPAGALKELGGWSSLKMVERYAHFSPDHLACYASAVSLSSATSRARPSLATSSDDGRVHCTSGPTT